MSSVATMRRLVLALVLTVVGGRGGRAAEESAPPVTAWLDVYDDRHQMGSLNTYQDSASSLGGWNDLMRSACLTGL